ncbi:MAG: tyrosine-type recombinase/integrase [Paludibacteraceae bacterium]|nr:tyrosine-type recombinase/integrase [Paludibacteraceae bacterium]
MIDRFVEYLQYERHYSDLTVQAYQRDLKQFCQFLETDGLHPDDVSENDIRAWIVSLMQQGIGARSVRRKLSSVKSFWRFCMKVGATAHDIPARIPTPKVDKPIPAFFKESEMEQVLHPKPDADDFVQQRDWLIIDLLYETGMRCSEMLGLTDSDITRQADNGQIQVHGKRNKQRIIPISNELLENISRYQAVRNGQIDRQDNHVFLRPSGKPMILQDVYKVVHKRMSEVSTVYKRSPHVLRHTFATAMLNHGADVEAIRALLGHESLSTTQIYAHTTFEELKKVYNNAHPRA